MFRLLPLALLACTPASDPDVPSAANNFDLAETQGDVACDNLFVNFDPANMILYGTGEPIEALQKLSSRVRSVHCKDACWAANPAKEWGQEMPLGQGEVGIEKYLETLDAIGYEGPLTIEREIPQEPERQQAEIKHAVDVLSRIKDSMFAGEA